ncbi:Variable outer membrane protein (plasmid) [Borrelia crocidurae DOU]|uniref:Variable outer membrane protein n=1 Tax=Borrelia crocidurae DOU TaxID=1293575 RepID=W5SLT6_9SPIR|nr:Vsp/OspC family lipoprotein [Borrelia crocidurae]AHH07847.1 Variable outer membrane protein [Borrelia crocidurae DOU]
MKEKKGLGEIGRREERREGRERRRILMMMMVVMMVMGCNSGGVSGEGTGEEGKGRKGDGSVIDLKVVSKKIKDAVEFAEKVKEIHTLVKSVDELAKAIGKKIKDSAAELAVQADKNASILAGAFNVVLHVNTKLAQLEKKEGISEELKAKVVSTTTASTAFLNKLKEKNADLGKDGVTDDDAKKAIDRIGTKDGDKGVAELIALNAAIDELLRASNKIVLDAMAELVVKPTT